MRRKSVVACLAAAAISLSAEAQTIHYQVGNGPTLSAASGQDITINVGTLSNGSVLVRVWDPVLVNGIPDDDAGKITISGDVIPGNTPTVFVLVAGPTQAWPLQSTTVMTDAGLRHMGVDASDGGG